MRMVRINLDVFRDIQESLPQFIQRLRQSLDEVPEKHRERTVIDIDQDDEGSYLELAYFRPATERENVDRDREILANISKHASS